MDNVKQKVQAHMFETNTAAFKHIWSTDGVRGFYIGTSGTVLRDIPFAIIQFPLYEMFKKRWTQHRGYDNIADLESWRVCSPLPLPCNRSQLPASLTSHHSCDMDHLQGCHHNIVTKPT